MQLSLQLSLQQAAPSARPVARRAMAASSSLKAAPRRPLLARRPQAAQEGGVETAEAASSQEETHVVPMSDSLVERAKLVVETNFVDEQFAESFVPELEAELASLRERAEQAEASAGKLEESLLDARDKFVRLQADFENFRKRTASEKEAMKETIRGDTIAELLPLVDNFELAKTQLKLESEGEKKVDAAYQGLYKQMVELFRGMGLEATPGVGSPFDPNMHDGIMRELNNDVPDGTVLDEFRKGFMFKERMLRPAMVKVSYQEGAPAAEGSDGAAAAEGGQAAAAGAAEGSEA